MVRVPDSDSTRRRFLKVGGSLVAGTSLAGCTGIVDSSQDTTTTQNTTTTQDTATTQDTTTTQSTDSYTVTMAPVGEVTFDQVPRKWGTYFPGYAEMGIALGQASGLSAVGNKSRFYTDHLSEVGVEVDKGGLTQLNEGGIDKETYYELGNDVHITDPGWLANNSAFGLESDDIDEIAERFGPFIGNTIFRRTDTWHDYRYYSMYEAFEKVARIFRKEDQYRAFESLHDDFISRVNEDLPPASDRPNGLLCFAASNEPESFSPYRISGKGTNKKQFHDLGIADALAGTGVQGLSGSNRGKIDYETLLEVDPDALFVRGHETKSREKFENTVLSFMKGHSVASELTAVENDDVYRGGPIYQGPIHNLFLTERFATTVYDDAYSGELFDRSNVADVVAGEF